jgi:hypothetical protein
VQPLLHARADAVDLLQLEAKSSGRSAVVMTTRPSGFCMSEPTLARNTFGWREMAVATPDGHRMMIDEKI